MATAPVISMYDLGDDQRTLASGGMEMRNVSTIHPLNGDSGEGVTNHTDQSSLEPIADTSLALQPDATDQRIELYARLRTIIDNAAESIRALKEENAALSTQKTAMTERIGALEGHIRTVTAALATDELALRTSADGLERALQGLPTAPTVSVEPEPYAAMDADAAPVTEGPAPQSIVAETASQTETEAEMESETEMVAETETETETESEPEAAMPVMEQAVSPSMEDTGPIEQTEMPAPVASDEQEHERVIAPPPTSNSDGTYTLVAYPFVRFSDLGQFQAALQKLTGVHDVQVRRFAQGTLEMRIGYGGPTDLATTLRTLATEIEDVQEEEPYKLRVRLRTSQAS